MQTLIALEVTMVKFFVVASIAYAIMTALLIGVMMFVVYPQPSTFTPPDGYEALPSFPEDIQPGVWESLIEWQDEQRGDIIDDEWWDRVLENS